VREEKEEMTGVEILEETVVVTAEAVAAVATLTAVAVDKVAAVRAVKVAVEEDNSPSPTEEKF
jgi:hypothetical protein